MVFKVVFGVVFKVVFGGIGYQRISYLYLAITVTLAEP